MMRRFLVLAASAALICAAAGCAGNMAATAGPDPAAYAAILADPVRPAADRERDAARRTAETLASRG